MASSIGIKIANGEFYSIVLENFHEKKRLVLTTVHDNQHSAQIDLYKSSTQTMADALYIGSLVIENIKPRPKGEPSIELVITSSGHGEISATAVEMGLLGRIGRQSLHVSLKSLDEGERDYELPDFEIDDQEPYASKLYERDDSAYSHYEKRKLPILLAACVILILIAMGFLLWFFVLRGTNPLSSISFRRQQTVQAPVTTPPAPTPPAATPPTTTQTPATTPPATTPPATTPPATTPPATTPPAASPPPVIQAPTTPPAAPAVTAPARSGRNPPVASYNVPSVIPREGVAYRVRWGDTLWDIADAFYRNPWLYPQIARFNNIRNPDLIISGTIIRVPPRN